MKPLMIAVVALALPLMADEPKTQTADTQPATTTAAPATTTAPPTVTDSPLVRAAKTKTTPKKKSIVITNKDLKKDGGHITTTAHQDPIPVIEQPGKLTPEQEKALREKKELEAKQAAEKAEKEKKHKDAMKARANADVEGDTPESLYDDPAAAEHRAEKATEPATTTTQKPPM